MSQHLCLSFTHSLNLSFGDRYEWSKVTSCIHNILSGQRWIEHYGEMSIKHSNTMGDVSHCKVTFLKVGPSRHAKFIPHMEFIPHTFHTCAYPCLSCPHLPLVEQPRPNSHFMSNLFITSSFIMILFFFLCMLCIQSRSGGLNANEVEGVVTDSEGRVIHSLVGKWNEALYLGKPPSATCIWRASEFQTSPEQSI